MNIEINIDDSVAATLQAQAVGDNVTEALWVERKINALLKKFIKDDLIAKINSQEIENLPRLKVALDTVVDAIRNESVETPIIQ